MSHSRSGTHTIQQQALPRPVLPGLGGSVASVLHFPGCGSPASRAGPAAAAAADSPLLRLKCSGKEASSTPEFPGRSSALLRLSTRLQASTRGLSVSGGLDPQQIQRLFPGAENTVPGGHMQQTFTVLTVLELRGLWGRE